MSTGTPIPEQTYLDAQRKHQNFQEEYDRLGPRLQQAIQAGDETQALKLQQRYDIMPAMITAARAALLKARITALSARLETAQAERAATQATLAAAQERLRQAQQEAQDAVNEYHAADQDMSWIQSDLAAAERELEGLPRAHEAMLAPVVRSLPHLPRRAS